MKIAMIIIVLMLLFYAAIILMAVKYGKEPVEKRSKAANRKSLSLNVSKEDWLVLSILPACFIAPEFGAFYFFAVIFWVVKNRKKHSETVHRDLVENGHKLEFSKQDKMKVLAGMDFKGKHPKAFHSITVFGKATDDDF